MDKQHPASNQQDVNAARTAWVGGETNHQLVDNIAKTMRSQNPTKSKRLKLWIIILVLLLMCLLTAFFLLLYFFLQSLQTEREMCTTPECVKSASNLLQSMDTTADPCDDFYQYACGNWHKDHPIPETSFSTDWFTDRGVLIARDVRAFLEQNNTDDPKPVYLARNMYKACTDIETLEKMSITPLTNFLSKIGLTFPIFTNSKTSVMDTLARINRYLDKRIFFAVSVAPNVKNRTENIITVGSPSDKSPVPSHKDHEKRVEHMLRKTLRRDNFRAIKAWQDYVVSTMKYFFQFNNVNLFDVNSTIYAAADKIIEFEIALTETAENFTSSPGYDVAPTIMTLGQLHNITDFAATDINYSTKIVWRRYFRTLFSKIDVKQITNQTKVAVYEIEYMKAISRLLAKTPVTTLLLSLWWEVVYILGPHTTNYMRDIRNDFVEKNIGERSSTSRSLACTSVVWELLTNAIGFLVVSEKFMTTTKVEVDQMVEDVQRAFLQTIEKTKWIDQETKVAIKQKARSIKKYIGFPDWLLDTKTLEGFYDDYVINDTTHVENILNILETNMRYTLENLNTTNEFNSTNFDALEVNALYDAQDNSITIPAGILQFPFFNLGLSALNYGAIGAILGHELVHAFDVNGRKFDKEGNMKDWWSNTSIANFTERMDCFINKYNDYYVEIIDDWVDGNLTLAENLADNGGLLAAFLGYQSLIRKNGKEKTLPGFRSYTNEQIFFLSYANIWCENWTEMSMKWAIRGEHSPNYVRVMATLSNLPQFAETWSCKPDVEMNPLNRCELW